MWRFLIEIWPAALPVAAYLLWMGLRRRGAHRRGEQKPGWKEGPLFWAVMASIAALIACLVLLGVSQQPVKGTYTPPHMENGTLVPGAITHE